MKKVTATDAARRFSDVLDAVEHRRETFVVVRKGRPVARIGPVAPTSGRRLKEVLRAYPPDADWANELAELRRMLFVEERPWRG